MEPRKAVIDDPTEERIANPDDTVAIETAEEAEELSPEVEPQGAGPDGAGDDAYQQSDEALPDDDEEVSIDRDPSREGDGLFGD